MNSESNRNMLYKSINPELPVHDVYVKNINVNEIERISWTRLRLSAHSLAVEKDVGTGVEEVGYQWRRDYALVDRFRPKPIL